MGGKPPKMTHLMNRTLRIKESATPGIYRFSIDEVDVSNRINRAEMYLYYGRHNDDKKQCRLLIGADFQPPKRYQMTVYRSKPNGTISTSNT